MRIPLHIKSVFGEDPAFKDRETAVACYALIEAMVKLNPQGFRTVGKKRGITKRHLTTRTEALARFAFDLKPEPKAAKPAPEPDERQAKVNLLTAWQRHQWARAGYPKDIDRFARMMKHPKSAGHAIGLAIAAGIRAATDAAVEAAQ